MDSTDTGRPASPLGIAVLTISDTRTEETDTSGRLLAERAAEAGHAVVRQRIIPDEQATIEENLRELIAADDVDVVITTGGTGLTARDVTPEAFDAVCEKKIPGFGELFRMVSYEQIGTATVQSRATAGIASATLLFAVPGSTNACRDAWDKILGPQLDIRQRPCNFAELLPRLR